MTVPVSNQNDEAHRHHKHRQQAELAAEAFEFIENRLRQEQPFREVLHLIESALNKRFEFIADLKHT